jgi:hypothetical protein
MNNRQIVLADEVDYNKVCILIRVISLSSGVNVKCSLHKMQTCNFMLLLSFYSEITPPPITVSS